MGSARPSADDDAALLAGLRAGDEQATTQLWQRYAPLVRGILRRSFGPRHEQDVDDLLQETFIQFFRQVPRLRDPGALRVYIIKIAANVVRGELRFRRVRRWVTPTRSGDLPDVADAGKGENDEARRALQRFYAVLERLSSYERTAYVLRFVEDLDLTEVAQALDVSLATVKRHLAKIEARVQGEVARDPVLAEFLAREEVKGEL